jgi:magnesium transporter
MGVSLAHPFGRLLNGRRRAAGPVRAEPAAGSRAFLYDAEATDGEVALEAFQVDQLTAAQLLWVDVTDVGDLPSISATFGLADETLAAIREQAAEPAVLVFDDYVQIAVATPADRSLVDGPQMLHCLVGANWVVTVHRQPVEFVEGFHERIRADSELGRIDSRGFLAAILQEHVTSYLTELRPIEAELDRLDVRSMTGRMEEEALLRELVRARIRLTRLRHLLEPHRELYARLSRSEFVVLSGSTSMAEVEAVAQLLERVLESMASTREMIAGSFEIYSTWAAHRTNHLMRRLTIVSVTLLPPTLIAGVMGMNALPRGFTTTAAFWTSAAAMSSLALFTLTTAWIRNWF